MNYDSRPDAASVSSSPGSRAIVLYEDLRAADHGVAFALKLSLEVGLDLGRHNPAESLWWLDMVEVPSIERTIGGGLRTGSYVILALSGRRDLSPEKKAWLRRWLAGPHASTSALIVLFDPERSREENLSAFRKWVQWHASDAKVNVFYFGGGEAEAARGWLTGYEDAGEDDDIPEDWPVGPIARFDGDDDHRSAA